ncbi:NAD(P)-dependent dehydrogenase, short-chain alcohol dehydrogenase family [Jatrophihabitans endophyticus]|uniref:NAD(P)-dependent dehydrogenase, short-chain alcohol dehydrogenase family n=1 Tax=Jatrophihabitans endophyticus TaxID=1206085 RepID=A0A1M5DQ75_9ACTN|nr:SDR family oxidoreductase [Jatrophihabitans endophyticus]SHF69137.1 NAD(P)-dependent dehydrogenase, short-chain alcohol dehydrogenase family [Jatrophihabitans endophyticus]
MSNEPRNTELADKTILLVGGRSGIAATLAADISEAGGVPVLAGRTPVTHGDLRWVHLDLQDEATIKAAAAELGEVDHVISLAAAHANGPVADLERDAVIGAFEAKVIGPILLAKHFGARVREGGSFLFFSGVAAWKPAPGLSVMATTNAAVAFLAEALAVELATVRVNALSPGIIDSGAWDAMGDAKDELFRTTAASNPARRVGTPADISAAAIALLTNTFITGTVLHVDGGGRLS